MINQSIYPDELILGSPESNEYSESPAPEIDSQEPATTFYNLESFISDINLIAEKLRSTGTYQEKFRESQVFAENPGAVIAGAGLAYNILTGAISTLMQGDVEITMPTTPIGVISTNPLPGIRSRTYTARHTIFSYRESNPITGIEQVNIQLECVIQYNGAEVQATFGFAPGGARSRLMRDTKISIRNPLSLRTMPAPDDWKRAGLQEYPVVTVPVEIRIDRPWPHSNYNKTFDLILSGMYGFGRDSRRIFKENERVNSN